MFRLGIRISAGQGRGISLVLCCSLPLWDEDRSHLHSVLDVDPPPPWPAALTSLRAGSNRNCVASRHCRCVGHCGIKIGTRKPVRWTRNKVARATVLLGVLLHITYLILFILRRWGTTHHSAFPCPRPDLHGCPCDVPGCCWTTVPAHPWASSTGSVVDGGGEHALFVAYPKLASHTGNSSAVAPSLLGAWSEP